LCVRAPALDRKQGRTEIGRRRFGVLFQNAVLWSTKTGGANVASPMQLFTNLDEIAIRRLTMLQLGLVQMEQVVVSFRPDSTAHAQASWPDARARA
jgi:ABC-type transporter Mla maintaining outer membrane lipid asymmetry ATPase subunit MlaF